MKILMVCLGNICRSPLAEGILQHKIREHGLNWQVDSAGTGDWHVGSMPDKRSIDVAKKYGIDIAYQRARHLKPRDLSDFDLIFTMDKQNQRDVLRMAKTDIQRDKIKMILNISVPDSDAEVPDPYYDNRFELVYKLLDEACNAIVNFDDTPRQ